MKKNNKKVSKVIHNPTVIYTDGIREQFEAVRQTEKGVIIGRILEGKFVDCGFISKRNIKEIKDSGRKA